MITISNLVICVGAVLWVICVSQTRANNLNQNCLTPNQTLGICIPFVQCTSLKELLRSPTRAIVAFVRSSQCGTLKRVPLVCCIDKSDIGSLPPKPNESSEPVPKLGTLPEPGICGNMLSDRIYGGIETNLDEHPWVALIQYNKGRGRKGFHCGGSLINQRYILTAAHCVHAIPQSWSVSQVRLGEWDIGKDPDCQTDRMGNTECAPSHIDVGVEKVITHEGYQVTSRNQIHDIALIRLARDINFTEFIKPICLPLDASLKTDTLHNHRLDIVGWGKTEQATMSSKKLKADVLVISLDTCNEAYSIVNVSLKKSHICAGGEEGIDSCRGDSGGPLIAQHQTKKSAYYYLAGIISFGPSPCGSKGWPAVYTRVSEYVDWIQQNIVP